MKKAILVTYPDKFVIQEALGLAEAGGYEVAKLITQRYLSKAKYGIGSGKAEELKNMLKDLNADTILFDEKLKSVQIYNLAKLTGVEVINRERLILEIFNKRASSAEAKLQVQLAELRYEIPRAREKVRLAKIGEQPGFFGLGRYDVDDYYRMIKKRTAIITKKLKQVSKRRELYRFQRLRTNLPLISFAGYTGAGKTSLFNILVSERKDTDKGLFTTLTTTTRSLQLSESRVLVSDTVGFISRLPPYMIEAFKATLEELTHANLVLLVID
ncbi:MAG: GTPase HflX, partial [Nitrososphaerales archaeon]